jgi:UDP-N-acetylglucosamine 2-epimerase (non-hydrolysing)
MTLKLDLVVGARPNFMKAAPLARVLSRTKGIRIRLIHTGQHFSPEMSQVFFEQLELPKPDVYLSVGSGSHAAQTARILERIEPVFADGRPDRVVVFGDVNSTVAAALAASKLEIPVDHVEAGLRSFDRSMPEEINRILTDSISDLLFVTEESGRRNLLKQGHPRRRIHFVGNLMVDTLLASRARAAATGALDEFGVEPGRFVLVTLHRPSNVDDPHRLAGLVEVIEKLAGEIDVIWPVHPRTRDRIGASGRPVVPGLRLLPPLDYLRFTALEGAARLVLTDSGGIQEETSVLGVPCLTVRENTERPVTIEKGTNRLAGNDPARVLRLARKLLAAPPPGRPRRPPKWDGQAAGRIAAVYSTIGRGTKAR